MKASTPVENMKVKRMPVNEQVFESMKRLIKTGAWKPNQKIPSEMELSESFDVNRLTVRMATQRLIGMGLLESRVGDGTYVKEFSFQDYMEKVSDFYLSPELMDQICEYRNAIEIESARLAIELANEQDLNELEEICNLFEKEKQEYLAGLEVWSDENFENLKKIVKVDVMFHRKVCEISHNELFVYAFDIAKELLESYIEMSLKNRIISWREKKTKGIVYNDMHREIMNAIKNKDYITCRKVYLNMVDYKARV